MEDGLRVVNNLLLLPDFGEELVKRGVSIDRNVWLRIYILGVHEILKREILNTNLTQT
jgi:hypothetical protein